MQKIVTLICCDRCVDVGRKEACGPIVIVSKDGKLALCKECLREIFSSMLEPAETSCNLPPDGIVCSFCGVHSSKRPEEIYTPYVRIFLQHRKKEDYPIVCGNCVLEAAAKAKSFTIKAAIRDC